MDLKSTLTTQIMVMITMLGFLQLTNGFRLPGHRRDSDSTTYMDDSSNMDVASLPMHDKASSKLEHFEGLNDLLDVLKTSYRTHGYPSLQESYDRLAQDRSTRSYDSRQDTKGGHILALQRFIPLLGNSIQDTRLLKREQGSPRQLQRGQGVHNSLADSGKDGYTLPKDFAVSKRRRYYNPYSCDISKVTLNTLIEFLRSRKICGIRVSHVRFGMGRK